MKRKRVSDELENFEFADIDKFALDEEWINQERMVGKAGKALADAKRDLDIAKSALEVKEANVDRRIRMNPMKYNMDKITEGAILNQRILEMEKKSEPKALIEAKHKVAILQVAMDRLSARGKAISDLIFLHSIEYFAAPKTPRGMKNNFKKPEREVPGVRPSKRKVDR